MKDEYYLMWLTAVEGIGNKKIELLLNAFENAREVWAAPRKMLEAVRGLTEQNINSILESKNMNDLQKQIERMEKLCIRFIVRSNPEYPHALSTIYDPPAGLYVMGRLPKAEISISVIGSRICSQYGRNTAYNLSKELAGRGINIVSGMAKGIDAMAHLGAIDAGGTTVAVLGCGVDVCYPEENRSLREKILEHGALISEYPPGKRPHKSYFPQRNRIISGLSQALLVVEAGKKSGTLITVSQALEQGREILAVPGNIQSKLSEGTNALIKEGAGMVTGITDIFDALGIFMDNAENNSEQNTEELAQEEKLIYDCIGFSPLSLEDIISNTEGGTVQSVSYSLLMLELKGYVKKLAGQGYVRS